MRMLLCLKHESILILMPLPPALLEYQAGVYVSRLRSCKSDIYSLCNILKHSTEIEGALALPQLVNDHVSALKLSYDPDSPQQSVTVKHHHIWGDVQRCFRKPNTNLKLPLRVVFVGEPAQVRGGPRREFLFGSCCCNWQCSALLWCTTQLFSSVQCKFSDS